MQVEAIFRALADPTRLRILRLLGTMELAVGELAQVLGQSQPRVSRHVGILCDAGLAERRREGSWVFLRSVSANETGSLISDGIAELLSEAELEDAEFGAQCKDDRKKLTAVRAARQKTAEDYFTRHASQWDELRSLHSPDGLVEQALLDLLGDQPLGRVLDIGTGTGRMAELFAEHADHIVALDNSLEMLRVARAKLQHLPAQKVELVQGDFTSLPFNKASFDTILLHQVLHFAQEPQQALAEAARVARGGAKIAIVDFAAHGHEDLREKHAHARLGFSDTQMEELLAASGFEHSAEAVLDGGELTVKIWIGRRSGGAEKDQGKENSI
ncbi:ArsR/SmtB family transcription factor [Altererythrobacter sp. GH1-8]|uniref:ArsR/SmtB family transcription factor n=1 Tax=Altererythrobacter sp. GH1-8 TaxID=3349333 RepID=UPI00374DCCED